MLSHINSIKSLYELVCVCNTIWNFITKVIPPCMFSVIFLPIARASGRVIKPRIRGWFDSISLLFFSLSAKNDVTLKRGLITTNVYDLCFIILHSMWSALNNSTSFIRWINEKQIIYHICNAINKFYFILFSIVCGHYNSTCLFETTRVNIVILMLLDIRKDWIDISFFLKNNKNDDIIFHLSFSTIEVSFLSFNLFVLH